MPWYLSNLSEPRLTKYDANSLFGISVSLSVSGRESAALTGRGLVDCWVAAMSSVHGESSVEV